MPLITNLGETSRKASLTLAFTVLCSILPIESAYAESLRIMAVGDSITSGTKGEKSYRNELEPLLTQSGCDFEMVGSQLDNNQATSYQSPHEGFSGHPANFFLGGREGTNNLGIDTMMTSNIPDVILIHLGSNDMRLDQSISGTVDEIEQIVTIIWNNNADAEVLVANVIPWYGSSTTNPNIQSDVQTLGTAIENWVNVENDTRLHLVDVRSGFTQSMMIPDNIHPNSTGEAHIADAFMDVMDNESVCPDTVPPATFIANPAEAGDSVPQTHKYSGWAYDPGGSGINRVRIAIEDNNHTSSSNRWWNFSTEQFGSFSETVAPSVTSISDTTSNWDITVTLPGGGDYRFYALAVDNAGNQDYYNTGVWPTNRQFYTSSDEQPPTVAIESPEASSTSSPDPTFSGSATDAGGSGFADVKITLLNVTNGAWYNFNTESFGSTVVQAITSLTNTTQTSTEWSITVNDLPPGAYRLYARVADNAGNASIWAPHPFSVLAEDTQTPSVQIVSPSSGATMTSDIVFSGNASDSGGSGFDDVRVTLLNTTNGTWYNFNNGSFGSAVVQANTILSNTTQSSTSWNISIEDLPPAAYRLYVRVADKAGNASSWAPRPFSVLAEDTQTPGVQIVSPSTGATVASDIVFSGNASDTGGSGFDDVRITLLNTTNGTWYNFNTGSFGSAAVQATTTMSNTTQSSTAWSISVDDLPPASYRIYARVADNAGNASNWTPHGFNVIADDNDTPGVAVDTPANTAGVILTSNATFSGKAFDRGGSGFKQIRTTLYNVTTGKWYNFNNATFGNSAIQATALLTQTTLTSTDWSLSVNGLPVATYRLYTQVIDNAGNTSIWVRRTFRVAD